MQISHKYIVQNSNIGRVKKRKAELCGAQKIITPLLWEYRKGPALSIYTITLDNFIHIMHNLMH